MERPLSPFMFPTWYRFQITSLLSIVHRLTGIALALGSVLLAWWLVAVAAGGDVFAATHAFLASPIGVLLLFGWSVAFFYHLCSGIRHLAWDAGYGFEIRSAYLSGYAVLGATAVLTVLAWLYVLNAYEGGLPSAHYLGVMADAAEKAGAPATYVAWLRSRPCTTIGG